MRTRLEGSRWAGPRTTGAQYTGYRIRFGVAKLPRSTRFLESTSKVELKKGKYEEEDTRERGRWKEGRERGRESWQKSIRKCVQTCTYVVDFDPIRKTRELIYCDRIIYVD